MKKQIISIVIIVLVVIAMIVGIYVFTDKSIKNSNENTQPTVSVPTYVPTNPTTSTDDDYVEIETEQDRELHLEDITIADRGGNEFVDDVADLSKLWEKPTFMVVSDFSNGFVATTTEHIECLNNLTGYAEFIEYNTGTKFEVIEKDALVYTINSLRTDYLEKYYPEYLNCKPTGFTRDDTKLNEGIEEYQKYFEEDISEDITNTAGYQILADTTIETALGEGLFVETYNKSSGEYYAEVYIKCERERIILIKCRFFDEDSIIPYITELTNSGIYLII